jgi:2,4-dienoyl-CoA reductase-like NADH-dependent reductase (Old Yellow Enzyme family)
MRLPLAARAAPVRAMAAAAGESPLFAPAQVGYVALAHRLVYAPLTRCRADGAGVQPPSAATYYAQRASAPGTLLISEATNIERAGQGYPNTPGLYTPAQLEAWQPVTAAVHAAGGVFFAQLWHTGRVSHPAYQPDGRPPPAPSAVPCPAAGGVTLPDFTTVPYVVPREMGREEIAAVVSQYAAAATAAIEAGFDGVEVHSANGYLLEQFLRESSNTRGDEYGGDQRWRLTADVVAAAAAAVGPDRVGVRLSPFGRFLMAPPSESDWRACDALVDRLATLGLAYLHMIEPRMTLGNEEIDVWDQSQTLDRWRARWVDAAGRPRPFISAGGFTRTRALAHLAAHPGDLIAVGRWWLSTPDLPARWAAGAPLNAYDRGTFYAGGDKGYTDYPFLGDVKEGAPTRAARDGSLVFGGGEDVAAE